MVQIAPRRKFPLAAGSLLGLWAALASFRTAIGVTSDLACPTEVLLCLGESDCGSCLEALQDRTFNIDFIECNELYVDMCAVMEDVGCDTTNPLLEDYAGCIAAEEFGCPEFVGCAAVTDLGVTSAPIPSPVTTAAPIAPKITVAPTSVEALRKAIEDSGTSVDSDAEGAPLGAIVGGTIGGVAVVAAIIMAVLCKTGLLKNHGSPSNAVAKGSNPRPPPPVSSHPEHAPEHEQQPDDLSCIQLVVGGSNGGPLIAETTAPAVRIHTLEKAEESDGGDIDPYSTSQAAAQAAPAASGRATPAVIYSGQASRGRTELPSAGGEGVIESGGVKIHSVERSQTATSSTAGVSTAERAELDQFHQGQSMASAASATDHSTPRASRAEGSEASSTARRRGSIDGVGFGQAVIEAAQELAHHCQIPGVSEAAAVLTILARLVSDSRDSGSDDRLRQCRSIVMVLDRAGKVAAKGGETTGQAQLVLIEDVHDAILDLVELIKTFQSKKKLLKVLTSTLFKRRQLELDAVVNRAITRLQLGLHVQVGQDVCAVKEGIHVIKGSIEEAKSESLAEARSARRQHKLDKAEIAEDEVVITDELLGSGGFGQVYLADLRGRNAAAKVLLINHDLGKHGDDEVLDGRKGGQPNAERERSQRKAFMRELDAMIRLRSPHTVNVYGVVTSLPDRLVLVMELLAGGDLRTLLKNAEQPLPEKQSRRIIGDICSGMTFLHGKETVHGDLKSANVLLDGAGRAKIADFGTSRWSQHTNSTGLATYTTKSSQNTQMSLVWSAPEVLDAIGSTYASDVYSFGVVAWEVLSRELPWANVTHPRDVYIRVVLKELRPDIPAGAPADMADMVRACWAGKPEARPAFSAILDGIKSNGWSE